MPVPAHVCGTMQAVELGIDLTQTLDGSSRLGLAQIVQGIGEASGCFAVLCCAYNPAKMWKMCSRSQRDNRRLPQKWTKRRHLWMAPADDYHAVGTVDFTLKGTRFTSEALACFYYSLASSTPIWSLMGSPCQETFLASFAGLTCLLLPNWHGLISSTSVKILYQPEDLKCSILWGGVAFCFLRFSFSFLQFSRLCLVTFVHLSVSSELRGTCMSWRQRQRRPEVGFTLASGGETLSLSDFRKAFVASVNNCDVDARL